MENLKDNFALSESESVNPRVQLMQINYREKAINLAILAAPRTGEYNIFAEAEKYYQYLIQDIK